MAKVSASEAVCYLKFRGNKRAPGWVSQISGARLNLDSASHRGIIPTLHNSPNCVLAWLGFPPLYQTFGEKFGVSIEL
jgi:hypothetical protein